MVASTPLAGAEMRTFSAPASRCLADRPLSLNRPVHSATVWTPMSPHGIFEGSGSEKTLSSFPSTTMPPPSTETSFPSLPWTLSYLSRWAFVAALVRSLTATTSTFTPDSRTAL